MKRQPHPNVKAFSVSTLSPVPFRRCGVLWGPTSREVAAETLSEEQQIELLNTPSLVVEEVLAGASTPPIETISPPASEATPVEVRKTRRGR